MTKTVDGVTHTYLYAGGKLLRETYGETVLDFFYDANGNPFALKHNGTVYYYITNLQGDVLFLVDADGETVAEYTYDPYGKVLTATGTLANTNPLRYRGYYYDPETGFYYLQSRYYDPTTCRFLNADDYASTGQGIIGTNMFAYCGNNPVFRVDLGGKFWDIVFDVGSLILSVIDVANNPSDPMAWVGLALDVVDVAVPFVGGLGEAADAVNAARKLSSKVDELGDAARTTQQTLSNISEAAQSLNKGNNYVYIAYKDDVLEYVGITNDFRRRNREWKGTRTTIEFVSGLDRTSARFVEQAVIDTFGMAKNGGVLSNKINSIGKSNAIYNDYLKFIETIRK